MFLNCPYHCSIPVFPLIIQFQYLCISGDKIYYVYVVVQVVYMDEPSTGLDPASRYNLWNVVKQSKEGRAIILTSMITSPDIVNLIL
jgi:ABC-type phosphate transport system ATPase subunit